MITKDPSAVTRARQPAGLELRGLSPDQAGLHASVAAAGFEALEELFVQLVTPDMVRLPGVAAIWAKWAGGRSQPGWA